MLQLRSNRKRHGFTLVELLIVVSMIVVLLAIALPTLKLAMKSRRVREASRLLNTYILLAQSRSAELGRPVGVWMERNEDNNNECVKLFMAESPPLYSGDIFGAQATVTLNSGVWTATFADDNSGSLPGIINTGDQIRFGYRDPYYSILSVSTDAMDYPVVTFTHQTGPFPRQNSSYPYQILRRPIRSLAGTVELPRGTLIDLRLSGIGVSGSDFIPASSPPADSELPLVVMFSSSGSVEQIFGKQPSSTTWGSYSPTGTLHFFVREEDDVELAGQPQATIDHAALNNGENNWVSVGHQSGAITSAENAGVTAPATVDQMLTEARQFATKARAMGGG